MLIIFQNLSSLVGIMKLQKWLIKFCGCSFLIKMFFPVFPQEWSDLKHQKRIPRFLRKSTSLTIAHIHFLSEASSGAPNKKQILTNPGSNLVLMTKFQLPLKANAVLIHTGGSIRTVLQYADRGVIIMRYTYFIASLKR